MPATDKNRLYTVSELARELGITPRALRFYEDKGLISPRRAGGSRVFDYRDKGRLALVLRVKRLGFTLDEIKDYLSLYRVDGRGLAQLERGYKLIQGRLRQLEAQRADLEKLLSDMQALKEETLRLYKERGGDPAALAALDDDAADMTETKKS
ncbi:MAG: MerR family DNA-binding transcriptional regulator [Rhodocyclaceae bacterium]|nr:MerR family DNA-binding transcriptional regulator [Rhodocyclaceae bacterium]